MARLKVSNKVLENVMNKAYVTERNVTLLGFFKTNTKFSKMHCNIRTTEIRTKEIFQIHNARINSRFRTL